MGLASGILIDLPLPLQIFHYQYIPPLLSIYIVTSTDLPLPAHSSSSSLYIFTTKYTANGGSKRKQRRPSKFSSILCQFGRRACTKLITPKLNEELHSSLKRLGIPPNYPEEVLFSESLSRVGGLGLIAIKQIPLGTPIISEVVLFSILKGRRVNKTQAGLEQFQALSCPFQPASPDDRFRANSFAMGKDARSRKERQGIFRRSSRLNHSCVPNAYFAWNEKTKRLTVHAIVNISEGQEIFVDYRNQDYLNTRDERLQALSKDYNFNCTCPACKPNTAFGIASEERRRRMRLLRDDIKLKKIPTEPGQKIQLLANIKSFILLLQQEGLFYPQLADMYEAEVMWYSREMSSDTIAAGDPTYKARCLEEALQVARHKLDLDVVCNGYAAPEVAETLELIVGLRGEYGS